MAAAEGEARAVVAAEEVAVEVVEREEAAAAVQALEEVLVAEKGRQVALVVQARVVGVEAAQVRGAQAPSIAGAFREVSRLGVLASSRLPLYLLDRCLVGERWVEV